MTSLNFEERLGEGKWGSTIGNRREGDMSTGIRDGASKPIASVAPKKKNTNKKRGVYAELGQSQRGRKKKKKKATERKSAQEELA